MQYGRLVIRTRSTGLVVDDFAITTGGVDVVTRDRFKEWASQFLQKIADFQFEIIETFQNGDVSFGNRRGRDDDLVEHCRLQVTLATGIPGEICTDINLGYRGLSNVRIRPNRSRWSILLTNL
jgi:hypothetical protein